MSLSDAIESATTIIGCYPNGGANAGKSYIGAIAATLASYPRQVALRCADRVHGVTADCKFLPTVADIVAWCERQTGPLYREAEREDRVADQIAMRDQPRPTAESMARVEEIRVEAKAEIAAEPSRVLKEANERAANEARKRRLSEVRGEWDGDAPTIAGTPVSRELVETMQPKPAE